MKEYIKLSMNKDKNEYYIFNKIPIFILKKFPPHISVERIIKTLEERIPKIMIELIDGIYVGEFEELKDRNIQALFKDGAIYLSSFSNNQNVPEKWITRDIVHELSHAFEDEFENEIYADEKIQTEFSGKKQKLFSLLAHEGYHFAKEILFVPSLINHLDDLLYKEIGYDKLSLIIPGLFMSPYSITSIREYFANGMEEYLLGEPQMLKKVSPTLYNKIDNFYNEKAF